MKKQTRIFMLLGLLGAALGAYIYFVEIKGTERKTRQEEERSRFFSLQPSEVTEISLQWETTSLSLRRGRGWQFDKPFVTEAKDGEVERLLEKVLELKALVTIGSGIKDRTQYGLQPAAVTLRFAGAGRSGGIDFGTDNPAGDKIYAMGHTDSAVVLVTSAILQNVRKTMYDLRDRDLNRFEREALAAVAVTGPHGGYTLGRTDHGWWLTAPFTAPADREQVTKILDRLIYNKAEEYVDENPAGLAAYGLSRPRLAVTVTDTAGQTDGFRLGKKASGNTFYAVRNGRKPLFTVSCFVPEALTRTASQLRDSILVRFYENDLTGLKIAAGAKTLAVTGADGIWQSPAGIADSARFAAAAGECVMSFHNMVSTGIAADAPGSLAPYGLASGFYEVTLTAGDKAGPVMQVSGKGYFRFKRGGSVYRISSDIPEKIRSLLAVR